MKKKQAFSLLELSAVILIIGIIITGVVQGERLINSSRVASARSLTKASPVPSIDGLTLWVETSGGASEDALTSTTNSTTPEDGDFISEWRDVNPQSKTKRLLSQSGVDSLKPNYVEDGINGIPSLRFDTDSSNEDYMLIVDDNTPIKVGDDSYTMFLVWQGSRDSSEFSGSWSPMVTQGLNGLGRNAGIAVGHLSKLQYNSHSNSYTPTTSEVVYVRGKPYIIAVSVNHDTTPNISLFTNGFMSQGTTTNRTNSNLYGANFTVGSDTTLSNFPGGLFSEIIVYNRNLTQEEVGEVNDYLSKKYGIKLDVNF